MAKIGLGLANMAQLENMKQTLTMNGHNIVFSVSDGHDVLRKARSLTPDIVILDFVLPGYPGYDVAQILSDDSISIPVLIVNENQKSICVKKQDNNDFVYLSKPFRVDILLNTLDILFKSKAKLKVLESEIKTLKDRLEDRKLIEKAKGLLVKKFCMTEDEAYKKMQKQSMDKGVSMREIAKALILIHEDIF